MVVVALPVWLIVVLCVALVLLLAGTVYGLTVFFQQLASGGGMEFEGALPVDEIPSPATDNPRYSPRLRGVDDRLARELTRQVEEDRGPR